MKKTTFADEKKNESRYAFAEDFPEAGKIAVVGQNELQSDSPEEDSSRENSPKIETTLDYLLSAVKWIFLYLPGVALIHLAMLGLALMFFYGDYELFSLLGLIPVGAFLMMFAFGKLRDLKYLKSVLTVLAFSFVLAIFYDILAIFIKGDFFGLYAKVTLPLALLVGYLSKRSVDGENSD